MIVEFTYTECTSPGPFKKGAGFKVKSFRIYKLSNGVSVLSNTVFKAYDGELGFSDQGLIDSLDQTSSMLDAATTHFAGFDAPNVGPFFTPEEFAAIPKGFIYDLVRLPGGKLAWLLARLSTSGPANGRPGNPFHQAFLIMDKPSKTGLIQHAFQNRELEDPRPIDFLTWTGWLNPRGDTQVDESNLNLSDLPFPEASLEELSIEHSRHIAEQGHNSLHVLSNVSRAFMGGTPVNLPGEDSEEFKRWVSVVSHLIPQSLSWFCGFGSTWRDPSPNPVEMGVTRFYWSGQGARPAQVVEDWAYLACKVFEYDLDLVVYDQINQVDRALGWAWGEHTSYALVPMPLALLGLPLEDFGEEGPQIALRCSTLLRGAQWPKHRGNAHDYKQLWESLETPGSLFSSLDDKNHIEQKLDFLEIRQKGS